MRITNSYAGLLVTLDYWSRELNSLLHQIDRLLPRRLTTRITLALVVIVVMAGLITTGPLTGWWVITSGKN